MGSPVGVGDVIVLSQIAFQIGQAFTSGRKSAPAEFGDVQKLLFTLGSALDFVAENLPKVNSNPSSSSPPATPKGHSISGSGNAQANTILGEILSNCRVVLEHLQTLVDKYSEIDPKQKSPEYGTEPSFRRWKDEFRRNWKKVRWTREGGGLDKLKVTLDVHISGLNLAMAALTKQQVSSLDAKLEEIYQWFQANLKGQQTAVATASPTVNASTMQTPKPRLTFAVWIEAPDTLERSLCCPSASFTDGWLDAFVHTQIRRRAFQCHCAHSCHLRNGPCTEPQMHHRKLDFTLLEVSLLVRLAEPAHEREWQMYVRSASYTQEVSILVNSMPPSFTAEFESQASLLAASQAQIHLSGGSNTMLVTMSVEDTRAIVSTLNMKSSLPALNDGILSVSFNSQGRTFMPERLDSIQLLHHRSIYAESLLSQALEASAILLRDQPYAELVFHCAAAMTYGEEVSYLVRLAPDTPVVQGEDERHVLLKDIVCIEESSTRTSPREILCSTVALKFQSAKSANSALHTIQSMRSELQISSLRSAQWGERIVLHRPDVGDLEYPPFHLASASLAIICNPLTKRYRLILLSGCHSLSVCLELPDEYLDALRRSGSKNHDTNAENSEDSTENEQDADTPTSRGAANMTAWFVQIGRDGTSVFRQQGRANILLGLMEHANVQRMLLEAAKSENSQQKEEIKNERLIEDVEGMDRLTLHGEDGEP